MADKNHKHRNIVFFKNYFQDFFDKQSKKVKSKIVWTFDLIEELHRVPDTYLKHIENTDGLYEIRVQQGSDIFRIFCFFDQGKLVVLANGFQKKTQKTPKKEIDFALKIKAEYEQHKKGRVISGFSFKFKKKPQPKSEKSLDSKRDPNTPDLFIKMTDAQRHLFANKMSEMPEMGTYSQGTESYQQFAIRIADMLLEPEKFRELYPCLEKAGFQP